MKVMKFGGTSVGNPESLQLVKKIIESEKDPVIVVVSALDGITDRLLLAADFALNNNSGYKTVLDEMIERHRNVIEKTITENGAKLETTLKSEQLFEYSAASSQFSSVRYARAKSP